MTSAPAHLPFFVYGTLLPGEPNHDPYLRGRVSAEEPARLAGALLYEGPGYPFAVETADSARIVHGALVTAHPSAYDALLVTLDRLEDYDTPGDPRNLYERVARDVLRADGTAVRAWVYVASAPVETRLRATGAPVEGGDWRALLTRRRVRGGPRTP